MVRSAGSRISTLQYRTVFDVSQTALLDGRVAAICFALILVGVAGVLLRNKIAVWSLWPKSVRHLGPAYAFIFLFITVAISANIVWSLTQSRKALIAKQISGSAIAEGNVSQFVPAPYEGHAQESFCLHEKCFNYSDYELTGGFNTTSSHGGPIREGLPVRVTYTDNTIVKLEVGVEGTASPFLDSFRGPDK